MNPVHREKNARVLFISQIIPQLYILQVAATCSNMHNIDGVIYNLKVSCMKS